ncbi:MAG: low affinity iron permease family protein [Acidobacteriota bacterium]
MSVKTAVVETRAQAMAQAVTKWTGSTPAFAFALGAVLASGITGPIFRYSDTWQLVMNTASSIVTFLMVFLIQRSQNKDALAMHVKLNEIVRGIAGASNRIVNVEDLSENELLRLQEHYQALARTVSESIPGRTSEIPLGKMPPR